MQRRFNPSEFSGGRTGAMVGGAASAAGMLNAERKSKDLTGLFGIDWHDVATSVLVGTVTALTTQVFLDIIERNRERKAGK